MEKADNCKYIEDLNNTVNKSDLVTYIPELNKTKQYIVFKPTWNMKNACVVH